MKSYQHHIGDFDKATRHLTRIERSIYRDLLDVYYDTEKPLTLDVASLNRRILARTNEEVTAVEQVLNEFFTETPIGWYHDRCESEIEGFRANTSQKALAGRISAAKREAKRLQALNGISTPVERPCNGTPTNQEPITSTNKEKESPNGDRQKSSTIDRCPHDEILDLYAHKLPMLAQPIRSRWADSKSAAALRARWREDERHQKIEFWEWFFDVVKTNPHWMGKNDREWKPDIHWFLKRENFDKVLTRGANGH